MAKVKLAIVTDIHYGRDVHSRLGSKAPRLMEHFTKAAARYGADALINMGDDVTATDEATDRANMTALTDHFNRAALPVFNVRGNHDIGYLSRADNEAITGISATNYSHDLGDYHLIFFNPGESFEPEKHPETKNTYLPITQADLDWLRDDLAKTDKPCIVFSHKPLDNVSENRIANDNDHSDDIATRFGYPVMAPEVRKILEDSGKVRLCMSGHIHSNRHREINGIHYISQQSLVSTYQEKYRVPTYAHSFLELEDNRITFKLRGKVKKTLDLTFEP